MALRSNWVETSASSDGRKANVTAAEKVIRFANVSCYKRAFPSTWIRALEMIIARLLGRNRVIRRCAGL